MRAAQSNQTENLVPTANRGLPGRARLVQALPMRPSDRARRHRARCGFPCRTAALALVIATFAGAAQAAERSGDTDRWVPSLGVFFAYAGQKAEGSVTSSNVLGPPLNGPPPNNFDHDLDLLFPGFDSPLQGCLTRNTFTDAPSGRTGALCPQNARNNPTKIEEDTEGSDTSIAPLVGGSLELMTPSPFDGFLTPRAFVHGDYAASFAFERNLAGKGSPGQFLPPETFSPRANDIEELAIRGQGSRTRWQLDRDIWSAGGGIAFTATLFQHTVRIKPSFEWIYFSQDFIGVVHRAVKQQVPSQPLVPAPGGGQRNDLNDLSRFRFISLTSVETKDFEGIGPGLEIEVDTARLGPIMTSMFLQGRGYRILGNLDETLTATNEFGETATWTFEPEPWMWRAGVGIRFRWVPERD